jgi:hypothetical protein
MPGWDWQEFYSGMGLEIALESFRRRIRDWQEFYSGMGLEIVAW